MTVGFAESARRTVQWKFQVSNSKFQTNHKFQIPNDEVDTIFEFLPSFGTWNLNLVWNLDLEAWNFSLRDRCAPRHPSLR